MLGIDPIILFFFLGLLASWARSDLEVPASISKFLPIYLLLSLGLKGGYEVTRADNLSGFYEIAFIGLMSCVLIAGYYFFFLRKKLGSADAAALAACYGSVSALTFVTAQSYLEVQNIAFSGFMVAVMAHMEIPAILIALFFYQKSSVSRRNSDSIKATPVFASKSVILLVGGFLIGSAMNEASWNSVAPVVRGSFKGVLVFFLLDLGVAAQKQMRHFWKLRNVGLMAGLL